MEGGESHYRNNPIFFSLAILHDGLTGEKKKKGTFMSKTGSLPKQQEIRERAYEIYISRGGADGQEISDWLQAEQELLEPGEKRIRSQRSVS